MCDGASCLFCLPAGGVFPPAKFERILYAAQLGVTNYGYIILCIVKDVKQKFEKDAVFF